MTAPHPISARHWPAVQYAPARSKKQEMRGARSHGWTIGEYLRKNSFTVTAYYTSNVEQYLFQNEVFSAFAENVRKLPITDKSLFIRSSSGRNQQHPARLPNHRSATLLQYIAVFLKDFDAARYQSHYDLVTTNYIEADKPQ